MRKKEKKRERLGKNREKLLDKGWRIIKNRLGQEMKEKETKTLSNKYFRKKKFETGNWEILWFYLKIYFIMYQIIQPNRLFIAFSLLLPPFSLPLRLPPLPHILNLQNLHHPRPHPPQSHPFFPKTILFLSPWSLLISLSFTAFSAYFSIRTLFSKHWRIRMSLGWMQRI